jgi:hypothetical protein
MSTVAQWDSLIDVKDTTMCWPGLKGQKILILGAKFIPFNITPCNLNIKCEYLWRLQRRKMLGIHPTL